MWFSSIQWLLDYVNFLKTVLKTPVFCKIIIHNIGRSPMSQYNSDSHMVLYWVQGSRYLQPSEAVTGHLTKELLMSSDKRGSHGRLTGRPSMWNCDNFVKHIHTWLYEFLTDATSLPILPLLVAQQRSHFGYRRALIPDLESAGQQTTCIHF